MVQLTKKKPPPTKPTHLVHLPVPGSVQRATRSCNRDRKPMRSATMFIVANAPVGPILLQRVDRQAIRKTKTKTRAQARQHSHHQLSTDRASTNTQLQTRTKPTKTQYNQSAPQTNTRIINPKRKNYQTGIPDRGCLCVGLWACGPVDQHAEDKKGTPTSSHPKTHNTTPIRSHKIAERTHTRTITRGELGNK